MEFLTVPMWLADYINSAFYATNIIYWVSNIRKLMKDKRLEGFVWHTILFYVVWCIWDVIFLFTVGSMTAVKVQCVVVCLQSTYLFLLFKYSREEKKQKVVDTQPNAS